MRKLIVLHIFSICMAQLGVIIAIAAWFMSSPNLLDTAVVFIIVIVNFIVGRYSIKIFLRYASSSLKVENECIIILFDDLKPIIGKEKKKILIPLEHLYEISISKIGRILYKGYKLNFIYVSKDDDGISVEISDYRYLKQVQKNNIDGLLKRLVIESTLNTEELIKILFEVRNLRPDIKLQTSLKGLRSLIQI